MVYELLKTTLVKSSSTRALLMYQQFFFENDS